MKHMLTPLAVMAIICFGALRAGADESALRLVLTMNGGEFDQFAVEDQKIVVREGEVTKPIYGDVAWRVEGAMSAQAERLHFPPAYTLASVDDPDVKQANAGRPYEAEVMVSGNDPGAKKSVPWTNEELKSGVVVFVWLVDGQPAKVTAAAALGGEVAAARATAKFFLTEEERRGAPAVLLYTSNGFLAPDGSFKDAAANRAAAEMAVGAPDAVSAALQKVRDVNARNDEGATLLHIAADNGLTSAVEALLEKGAKPGVKESSGGNTALHWAARKGRGAVVERLLKARAAVDAANEADNTPLFFAIQAGHEDVARDLLTAGADWSLKNANGQTAAELALDFGRAEVLRAMSPKKGREAFTPQQLAPALIMQIRRGNTAMVRFILEQKMEPNLAELGATPLLEAARHGRRDVAELLLKAGTQPDVATRAGTTPLYLAASGNHVETAEALLAAGADPNRVGVDKMAPLHLAVLNQSAPLIKALVAKGARLDVQDEVGRTPLELALITQAQSAAEALAEAGARLDAKSKYIESLIESAIMLDVLPLIERAVEDGWSVASLFYGEWPAWRVAELYGAPRTAAWLKKRSGDVPAPEVVRLGKGVAQPKVEAMVLPDDPRDPEKNYGEFRANVDGIIDTKGRFLFARVRNATDLPFKLAVLQVVPAWRFTPAMRDGAPVNSRIALPLSFPALVDRIYQVDELDAPPVVEYMPPLHTATMVSGGQLTNRGWITNSSSTDLRNSMKDSVRDGDDVFYATVRFILSKEGKPEDIEVVPGSNMDFGEKIKDALRKARYKPATHQGQPVRVRMAITQNMR